MSVAPEYRKRSNVCLPVVFLYLLIAVAGCRPPVASDPQSLAFDLTKEEKERAISSVQMSSLHFIKNQGQIDESVNYYVKGRSGTVYFKPDVVVFHFVREKRSAEVNELPGEPLDRRSRLRKMIEETDKGLDRLVFRMRFEGANSNPEVVGRKELLGKVNYFIGSDQSKWYSGIPTFEEILYKNIYDGIDLKFYFRKGNPEYMFIAGPGADPSKVVLHYEGVEGLDLSPEGNLIISTRFGDFVEKSPQLYQEIAGVKVPVGGTFELKGDNRVVFDIPSYDSKYSLMIDPSL
jgi:hypothetical protein